MAAPEKEQTPQKSYQQIFKQEISEGLRELNRRYLGLPISGISVGLEISFGVLLVGVLLTVSRQPADSPVGAIVLANVAGSGEVLTNIFAGRGLNRLDFGFFLLWAAAGNAIGGVVFVALLKCTHVIRGATEPKPVRVEELQRR